MMMMYVRRARTQRAVLPYIKCTMVYVCCRNICIFDLAVHLLVVYVCVYLFCVAFCIAVICGALGVYYIFLEYRLSGMLARCARGHGTGVCDRIRQRSQTERSAASRSRRSLAHLECFARVCAVCARRDAIACVRAQRSARLVWW